VGCFSFYATKNITTGEGGVVTTDDDEIATALRVLRNQGQRTRYEYERPGFNLRMTEMQAALGVAQMSRMSDVVEIRRANARALSDGLAGVDGLILPTEPEDGTHVFHQYTVRVEGARLTRDELFGHLRGRGVESGVYYPRPVFGYDCFRLHPRVGHAEVPATLRACREVLSLPVHPSLSEAEIEAIIDSVREVMR
jgi:dTDP-4-amino-4,6-dideoxygalactose transaminase